MKEQGAQRSSPTKIVWREDQEREASKQGRPSTCVVVPIHSHTEVSQMVAEVEGTWNGFTEVWPKSYSAQIGNNREKKISDMTAESSITS